MDNFIKREISHFGQHYFLPQGGLTASIDDWQVAGIKCPFVHVDATAKSCQTTGKSPISPTKFARDHIAPIQSAKSSIM
jgi:hypothetical protein